jgi:hypothetical protein
MLNWYKLYCFFLTFLTKFVKVTFMKILKWLKKQFVMFKKAILQRPLLFLLVGTLITEIIIFWEAIGKNYSLADVTIAAFTWTLPIIIAWWQSKENANILKQLPEMLPEMLKTEYFKQIQKTLVDISIKPTEETVKIQKKDTQKKDTSSNPSFVSNSTDDYDIFVSYVTAEKNWATELINNLQERLGYLLQCKNYSVWMNEVGSTPDIDKLKKSATLLIILSPDYLKKQSVLTTLLTHIKKESGKVFIVECNDVQHPESIANLTSYKLWVKDGSNPSHPLKIPKSPYEGLEYYKRISPLATKLTDQLKELKKQPFPSPSINNTARKIVFLAEVTDDLEEDRDRFKQLLEQKGCEVLPRHSHLFYDDCEQRWHEDINKSMVFVQLLSEKAGKPERPHPWLQYQCVKETDKSILQWCGKRLEPDEVTNDKHRILLRLDTMMAIGIEEFRYEVLQMLKSDSTIDRSTQQPSSAFWIFVNAVQADESFARKLMDIFTKHDIPHRYPRDEEKYRTNVRKVREQYMRDCYAMVVVYGQSEPDWVSAQFSDLVKFSCKKNAQPCLLAPGAVCEAPPLPKPSLNIKVPSFRCTDASLENQIVHFLSKLRNHP